MGYRLEGRMLDASGDERLSFGLVAGAVQVPRSGQPILLMADHGTAGGYPLAPTVATAATPAAAQPPPGAEPTFSAASIQGSLPPRAAPRAARASLTPSAPS